MNKHKLILSIFLLLLAGFLYAQDRNFEKEIQETEKQIQDLQLSIDNDNKELDKLQSQEKSTSKKLSITKKSIQSSKSLINAYNRKIDLYNLQLKNLRYAVDKNNKKILNIKNSYENRSINIYKKKDNSLNNFIFTSNSISQAVYRIKYYNVISDINREVLTKLNTTQLYNEKKKNPLLHQRFNKKINK